MDILNEKIAEAMDILIKKRLSELSLDSTIEAEIYSVADTKKGLYKAKYQTALIDVYADSLDKIYKPKDRVFVKVPNNNFTSRKIIQGKTDSVEVPVKSVTEIMDVVQPGLELRENVSSEKFFSEGGQYDTIQIAADFILERDVDFNYGLKVTIQDADEKDRVYILEAANVDGDPFTAKEGGETKTLSGLFKIPKGQLVKIKNFQVFPQNSSISMANPAINFVQLLDFKKSNYYLVYTIEEDNTYSLKLLYQGKDVTTEPVYSYYWYKKETAGWELCGKGKNYHITENGWYKAVVKESAHTIIEKNIFYTDADNVYIVKESDNQLMLNEPVIQGQWYIIVDQIINSLSFGNQVDISGYNYGQVVFLSDNSSSYHYCLSYYFDKRPAVAQNGNAPYLSGTDIFAYTNGFTNDDATYEIVINNLPENTTSVTCQLQDNLETIPSQMENLIFGYNKDTGCVFSFKLKRQYNSQNINNTIIVKYFNNGEFTLRKEIRFVNVEFSEPAPDLPPIETIAGPVTIKEIILDGTNTESTYFSGLVKSTNDDLIGYNNGNQTYCLDRYGNIYINEDGSTFSLADYIRYITGSTTT